METNEASEEINLRKGEDSVKNLELKEVSDLLKDNKSVNKASIYESGKVLSGSNIDVSNAVSID